MKPGDLVIRKIRNIPDWKLKPAFEQRERLGFGIVLATQVAGSPAHPTITVVYPKTGKIYDIAESLMEVISASR
jgi:hypothetical protein